MKKVILILNVVIFSFAGNVNAQVKKADDLPWDLQEFSMRVHEGTPVSTTIEAVQINDVSIIAKFDQRLAKVKAGTNASEYRWVDYKEKDKAVTTLYVKKDTTDCLEMTYGDQKVIAYHSNSQWIVRKDCLGVLKQIKALIIK